MTLTEEVQSCSINLPIRPRRNRFQSSIRSLLQETHLLPQDLIAPLFIVEGSGQKQPIKSMPGVFRFSIDIILEEIAELKSLGIAAINLFACIPPEKKDRIGSEAYRLGNLLDLAISTIKKTIPDICLMVDIALDPYTELGHDGYVNDKGEIDNDISLQLLGQMSLLAAQAGADYISPSDMMDGRVGYLRSLLDRSGHSRVGIVSYAAKFASAFYGPFREALESAPKTGDKKSYQLNPANVREALYECYLDEQEGADMLLIKPALPYLDVVAKVKQKTRLPVGAYHVSGEYAMIMAAAKEGWLDADKVLEESLLSIKRAGADFIFTYGAKRMAQIISIYNNKTCKTN